MTKTKCFYPGSFDPLTHGHVYVVTECAKLFDQVVIGIGENSLKKGKHWFSSAKRAEIIMRYFTQFGPWPVSIQIYTDRYFIQEAIRLKCTHIVRGIRGFTDLDEELGTIQINDSIVDRTVAEEILGLRSPTPIFIPTPVTLSRISSSMVKSLVGYDGWEDVVKKYVPQQSFTAIIEYYNENF